MKVSDVLYPLQKNALRRLCQRRNIKDRGNKKELRTFLAHSYRGNLPELVEDLRRVDLQVIRAHYVDTVEFPPGLWAMSAEQFRYACLSVFEGRYPSPKKGAELDVQDVASEEGNFVGPDGEKAEVALYVTGPQRYISFAGEFVNEMALQRMAANADSVTVLSAYYVRDVLETIAGACRGNVRIILNGLGGKRLTEQVRELLDLQTQLHEPSRPVEIGLAFAEGLFHTKMYLFHTGTEAVAWVGSANATKAGLNGRNEEVLVKLAPAPRSVLDYAEDAWCRATPLNKCQDTVNSLIAFFRTGALYYKPYALLQMTINPFRNLMKDLPSSEKRKFAPFESAFADPEGGIGAFNLNLVFEERSRMETQLEEPPDGGRQVQLRRYAVETCYGYWVAEPFHSTVDHMLNVASEGKRLRLKAIRDWMKMDRNTIIQAYESYLGDVREMLDVQDVDWGDYASEDLFENTMAVERRIDALLAALDTKRGLERLSQTFVSAEVPEIWDDTNAYSAFTESFFGSLAKAWSARSRSGSAKQILDSIPWRDGTPEAIRAALEEALRNEGWYEAVFIGNLA